MEQQARTPVRAHQGQREEAGPLHEAGQGNCGTHRQQGAGAEGGDEELVLAVPVRLFELGQRRPDEGAAVPAGETARDRRALEDEQAAASASRLPAKVAAAPIALAMLAA